MVSVITADYRHSSTMHDVSPPLPPFAAAGRRCVLHQDRFSAGWRHGACVPFIANRAAFFAGHCCSPRDSFAFATGNEPYAYVGPTQALPALAPVASEKPGCLVHLDPPPTYRTDAAAIHNLHGGFDRRCCCTALAIPHGAASLQSPGTGTPRRGALHAGFECCQR